mgnify:CR=1 FL=1
MDDQFDWKSLLHFDAMLTPMFITLIYWGLLVLTAITGLALILADLSMLGFIMGLFTMLIGAFGARISCEILIVIFKIHENLHTLADKESSLASKESSPADQEQSMADQGYSMADQEYSLADNE